MGMLERRSVRIFAYAAAGVLGALAILFTPFAVLRRPLAGGLGDPTWIVARSVALALALAWVFTFEVLRFRKSDEFVQQGRRVAWLWGARFGLVTSALLVLFILSGGLHWFWPATPSNADFRLGITIGFGLTVFMQIIGSRAVWFWWRLSKR
jgi:hypothetical protein